MLAEVRDRWEFYRDRRPDAYGAADRRRDVMTTLITGGTVDLADRRGRHATC